MTLDEVRLAGIRARIEFLQSEGFQEHLWIEQRDLLAMIDARDREIVALREVVQSLQQEGSGRVRYD